MKVYEATTGKSYRKVPEIKIKNRRLLHSGFPIGKKFSINYEKDRIILNLIQKDESS